MTILGISEVVVCLVVIAIQKEKTEEEGASKRPVGSFTEPRLVKGHLGEPRGLAVGDDVSPVAKGRRLDGPTVSVT